mgnify:CR=1 FL=1
MARALVLAVEEGGGQIWLQSEPKRIVVDGKQVVIIFDWTVSNPFQGTFRMCEYFQVENGKILSAELYFDTANFPKMYKNAA